MTFLEGFLTSSAWQGQLLRVYVGFLLLRCEVLLLFVLALAAGTSLYLRLEQSRGRLVAGLSCIPVFALILLAVVLQRQPAGTFMVTVVPWSSISMDDLKLTAWMDKNLPPEKGNIGLTAMVFEVGGQGQEKHIYALGGASAPLVYGKHLNFRFGLPALERRQGYDDYIRHIRDHFDADWCLDNEIRYFFADRNSLYKYENGERVPVNPGVIRALEDGRLKLLHLEGSSGIYTVHPEAQR
jgi:hypothetical protein